MGRNSSDELIHGRRSADPGLTPSDTGSLTSTGAQYSASYTYDTLNRLTTSPLGSYTYGDSAHADAATAIGSGGSAWTASYDASGNMLCRAASGATTCSGTTPTGAQLAYDNQGQLAQWLSAPTTPTSSASYLYDGEGHRIQQVATTSGTTTTTSYIGSLEEVATTGATTTTTAYYGGLALSVNGALSYTLSDGLGSVSESVNASTEVVSATQLYGPYGSVRYQSGALPTSYGYTHQRSDALSGLDYYGARYYDPLAGQFSSADTTLAGGLNRYAYVGGNPETATDPTGHMYTQNTHPYYQDFGASVYALLSQDQGASNDGTPTALFIALNDPVAYRAAEGYGASHGVTLMPNVGRDAFLYRHTRSNAYWNSTSAHMTEYLQLTMLQTQYVELITGGGSHSENLNMFTSVDNQVAAAASLTSAGDDFHPVSTEPSNIVNCGESFTADTRVATPSGERPIASLRVGDHVSAYTPATGQQTTQTIKRVFLNHDTDRLDVTLALPTRSSERAQQPVRAARTTTQASGHAAQTGAQAATRTEVIHTTANHPWLTADHGWLVAGALRVGEPVRLLDGGVATAVALHALPGVGPMWDLSLDAVHTFAVGDAQAVVHNCGLKGNARGIPGDLTNKVPGQPNLYTGQGADTDALAQDGWTMIRQDIKPNSSVGQHGFADFIRSKYPNEYVSKWEYIMETWSNGTESIENHYWSNSFDHPGEWYHHH